MSDATGDQEGEYIRERARFGERVRALRLEHGLRLSDVAALVGVTEPYLSRLERGMRWPSIPILMSLARAYGVDPTSLFGTHDGVVYSALHSAKGTWTGGEATGTGLMSASGVELEFNRFRRLAPDTDEQDAELDGSPEQVLGMSLAGSFSMALACQIEGSGGVPHSIDTTASVHSVTSKQGHAISDIQLICDVDAEGIEEPELREMAQITSRICVVGRALMGVSVSVICSLVPRSEQESSS